MEINLETLRRHDDERAQIEARLFELADAALRDRRHYGREWSLDSYELFGEIVSVTLRIDYGQAGDEYETAHIPGAYLDDPEAETKLIFDAEQSKADKAAKTEAARQASVAVEKELRRQKFEELKAEFEGTPAQPATREFHIDPEKARLCVNRMLGDSGIYGERVLDIYGEGET